PELLRRGCGRPLAVVLDVLNRAALDTATGLDLLRPIASGERELAISGGPGPTQVLDDRHFERVGSDASDGTADEFRCLCSRCEYSHGLLLRSLFSRTLVACFGSAGPSSFPLHSTARSRYCCAKLSVHVGPATSM